MTKPAPTQLLPHGQVVRPAVYKPQATGIQAKTVPSVYKPQTSATQAAAAPPVYRPNTSSPQAKLDMPARITQQTSLQPGSAPPVYRPQLAASKAKPTAPGLRPSLFSVQPKLVPGHLSTFPGAAVQRSARASLVPQSGLRNTGSGSFRSPIRPGWAGNGQGCVQMVRPKAGATIDYDGNKWEVTSSSVDNPNISIKRVAGKKTHQSTLAWETEAFAVVRPNTDKDYDMRKRGVAGGEAKQKALDMMKDYIRAQGGWTPANVRPLNDLDLGAFQVTQTDASVNAPCEWQASWKQTGKSGRTWELTIDMDRPLPSSDQEPHVGWTLRTTEAKNGYEVSNQFGHVWVDSVPASRQ